jgi:hypothetical protein
MAKHNISFADKKLIGEISAPEVLTPLVPRIGEVAEGAAMMRSMNHEISELGKFTRRNGFTPGRDFQRVASIPASVRAAILQVHPDAFTNKKVFYELLEGPLKDYDLRSKIVI